MQLVHIMFYILSVESYYIIRFVDSFFILIWNILPKLLDKMGPLHKTNAFKSFQNNQLSFTEEVPQIILSESGHTGDVEIADDYTKRKHVFRIKTSRSEILYQADSEAAFQQWLASLEAVVGSQHISRVRKLTSASTTAGATASNTRNRSPTGHSPATKSRKPSSGENFFVSIFGSIHK